MDNDERRERDLVNRSEDPQVRRESRERLELGETIGTGMHSPDSTQVPLSAETGEPDERAMRGRSHEGDAGAGDDADLQSRARSDSDRASGTSR